MSDEAVRRAWAYLSRVAEPPFPALDAFVKLRGAVEAASMIQAGHEPAEVQPHVEARRGENTAASDLEMLDRRGGRLVTPDDDEWPLMAFAAFDSESAHMPSRCRPPMVLWAIGPARLDDIAERSAAVVGTRAMTSYGEHVTADISAGLVDHDVTVVSGAAYGVDGAAHRAALAADGTTVAVLACGIDISYPGGHSALLHRISGSGLLVTEYPPGIRPARHRFLTRNRLVAALSGATVVVEAGLRSGAANTAAWAQALGRVVGAVPGPVTSSASAGCHRLLRRGAVVVTRAADIVELVGRIGELADEPQGPSSPFDGLSDAERIVYEALPARGLRDVDQIAVASALPAEQVLAPLALLEIAGLVEKCDGRWRLAQR